MTPLTNTMTAATKELCPTCHAPVKNLKHTIVCDCGVRFKTLKKKKFF